MKAAAPLFTWDSGLDGSRIAGLLRRLPLFEGKPIHLERCARLRDRRGPVHGGAFLRRRKIAVACSERELRRIIAHELHHFVWLRLGNCRRRSYEELLGRELDSRARGELGWSAEWRKRELSPADREARTRRWREYCCESFCDTAAWLYAGLKGHDEFTLARRFREGRRAWFAEIANGAPLSI